MEHPFGDYERAGKRCQDGTCESHLAALGQDCACNESTFTFNRRDQRNHEIAEAEIEFVQGRLYESNLSSVPWIRVVFDSRVDVSP
jgi:hypothetical protein